jgi:hypothetical protein
MHVFLTFHKTESQLSGYLGYELYVHAIYTCEK